MGFWEVTLGGLLGSGIAAALVGALLTRRIERIQRQVEEEFGQRASRREYQRQALFELFGPAKMQFLRTKRAFNRWGSRNDYLEGKVVRTGNMTIRDLLLEKGHLIPPDLVEHAEALIEHYDAWLEKYEREREKAEDPSKGPTFIFTGPDGYRFPTAAQDAFLKKAVELQRELYGSDLG